MAASDDDCDLDTLTALLEEDSSDVTSVKDVPQQQYSVKGSDAIDDTRPSSTENVSSNTMEQNEMESDEMDMEALSSLLDQDPDFEDAVSEDEKGREDVTADEIAAFFDESSDSETESCTKDSQTAETEQRILETVGTDGSVCNISKMTSRNVPLSPTCDQQGTEPVDCDDVDGSQSSPQHVKKLQDELAMMQRRMMEIQQMLASQSSAPPTTESPLPVAGKKDKQHPKVRGLSATPSSSSSTTPLSKSSKASKQCSKKTPDVLSPSHRAADKTSPQPTTSSSATGKSRTYGKVSNHVVNSTSIPSRSPDTLSMSNNQQSLPRHSNSSKSYKLSGQTGSQGVQNKFVPNTAVNSKAVHRKGGQEGDGGHHTAARTGQQMTSTFLSDVTSGTVETTEKRKSLKSALFGDDSDSDWEDMEGNKTSLSSAGQDIKKLLVQGERQRQAHTPSYSRPPSASTTWKSKATPSSTQGNSASIGQFTSLKGTTSIPVKSASDDKDCSTEKFSGIRIKNPKISSIMLAAKMEGRKMIPVPRLHLKVKSPDLQSDWVTIGVVVQKSDARKSKTGKTYSIWKLNDLQDTETSVSFFLFGQVYKQLWKMSVGTVIGLLNCSIMDPSEKSSGEVAITINNPQQVMEIGESKDLGWCIGKTKRGNTCSNVVNKKFGDFCTYHVQAAYRKQSAKRSELHGSCPGTAPKSSLKSKILQNNTFFYGGESFSASRERGTGSKKDKVTLAKLQSVMTQREKRKVNTLAIQNLLPAEKARMTDSLSNQHQQPFLDMLTVPTAGSMNLVHHIAKNEGQSPVLKGIKWGQTVQSINAGDLLKQHRQEIADEIHKRKQKQKDSSSHESTLRQPQNSHVKKPSHSSSDNLMSKNKSLGKRSPDSTKNMSNKKNVDARCSYTSQTKGSLSGDKDLERKRKAGERSSQSADRGRAGDSSVCQTGRKGSEHGGTDHRTGDVDSPGPSAVKQHTPPGSAGSTGAPVIGRGFYPGREIDLSFDSSSGFKGHKPSSLDVAKRKAIQKVQAAGGLEKADPNAVGKPAKNSDQFRKRVLENIENDKKDSAAIDGGSSSGPPKKKSRLLGDVDPNSEEVQKLLMARSSHVGALAQAEADREERYFDNLEMKEKMEDKMRSVTSMEVTVVTCEQCKYTATAQGTLCKQQGHTVRRHKGKRRFFACKKCKHRTVSLQRYPTSPCKKCGEHSFEKTSMHQERSGPKLESETLCLRGDESKFINAMEQKVYMTTFE